MKIFFVIMIVGVCIAAALGIYSGLERQESIKEPSWISDVWAQAENHYYAEIVFRRWRVFPRSSICKAPTGNDHARGWVVEEGDR